MSGISVSWALILEIYGIGTDSELIFAVEVIPVGFDRCELKVQTRIAAA